MPLNAITMSPADIDQAILDVNDEMESATVHFDEVLDQAANAEADFKGAYARSLIRQSNESTGRTNAQLRDAIATAETIDKFRAYKVQDARKIAAKEYLLTLRARLDGLRSLGANLRTVTTGRT